MKKMNRTSLLLWVIAIVISLATAVYQRKTGPTYPVSEKVTLGDHEIGLLLERSHAGPGDQMISVAIEDTSVTGDLLWRRYPTREVFTSTPMHWEENHLVASLPHQPPAGKLEYRLHLQH